MSHHVGHAENPGPVTRKALDEPERGYCTSAKYPRGHPNAWWRSETAQTNAWQGASEAEGNKNHHGEKEDDDSNNDNIRDTSIDKERVGDVKSYRVSLYGRMDNFGVIAPLMGPEHLLIYMRGSCIEKPTTVPIVWPWQPAELLPCNRKMMKLRDMAFPAFWYLLYFRWGIDISVTWCIRINRAQS